MIIDLDSHLRENVFMDEVYKLEPPYEEYTPVRREGPDGETRFETKFPPILSEMSRRAYDHGWAILQRLPPNISQASNEPIPSARPPPIHTPAS